MYGVVIWKDRTAENALIWCEDHGDLAYYKASDGSALDGESFDAGDLVHFDVRQLGTYREASNPIVVDDISYSKLPETLRKGTKPSQGFLGVRGLVEDARLSHASCGAGSRTA